MIEIDYEKLAKEICEHQIPFEFVAWDKVECAKYFHSHELTFSRDIASQESFPKPIIATGKDQGRKLWRAIEVVNWFTSQISKLK